MPSREHSEVSRKPRTTVSSCEGDTGEAAGHSGLAEARLLAATQPYRQVFATLLEALSQHGDHVFVVVQKLLDQLAEASLHVLILDLQPEPAEAAFTSIHDARCSQNSS